MGTENKNLISPEKRYNRGILTLSYASSRTNISPYHHQDANTAIQYYDGGVMGGGPLIIGVSVCTPNQGIFTHFVLDMSTEWEKYIAKSQYREILLRIISDIADDQLGMYTIKKLVGYTDLYRIRKGKIRIIFRKCTDGNEIVAVDTRGDIYKQI